MGSWFSSEVIEEPTYKIIVVGESSVGKTSLLHKFCKGWFLDPSPTIGVDIEEKSLKVGGANVKFNIWDSTGIRKCSALIPGLYDNVDAVFFVYDVTCKESLLKLDYWIEECGKHGLSCSKMSCAILGNKCEKKTEKAVSTLSSSKFGEFYKIPVFEISAKESENDVINAIFKMIARSLMNSTIEEGYVIKDYTG